MFFPEGGLAISIASTVWVGVLVVCFFNLRLGWSLSGFVIPGFLAPLFITHPLVGAINIVEGIITYLIAQKLSELGAKLKQWNSFFGRDRFLVIIISSIIIKLLFDGFLFGIWNNFLQIHYNYQFDYALNINSYGLIVVALIANQLWEEGVRKEIVPLLVTILITYLIVRYGLMEFSNFRMSQINSLYVSMAEIFPASGKVYIILIVTVLISSHMGIKYGWDYGGIITSGLLALQWFSPFRVGMTLIEAFVIYVVCSLLLKTDFLQRRNVVKARKILLFFNVGFLYKLLLGDAVMSFFPEERILEFYGFGYMLSTLLALKMHDNNSSLKLIMMILHTSFSGFLGGSLIALSLVSMINIGSDKPITAQNLAAKDNDIKRERGHLIGYIQASKNAFIDAANSPLILPNLEEIKTLDVKIVEPLVQTMINAKNYSEKELNDKLQEINKLSGNFGYSITLFDDSTSKQQLVIFAPDINENRAKNWGTYIFRPQAVNDYLIEVPRPFDEINSLDYALYLFQKASAQSLLIGGTSSDVNKDRSGDLTRSQSKGSLYNLISQVLLRDHVYTKPVIQIRGYSLSFDSIAKPSTDILIAFSDGASRKDQLTNSQTEVLKLIETQNLSYNIVASDEQTTGYEVGELFLSRYLLQTPNKELAVVWLSPWLRSEFRNPDNNFLAQSFYNTLDIPLKRDSLENFLAKNKLVKNWQPEQKLKDKAELYARMKDIIILKNIQEEGNYKLCNITLDNDGKSYFAFFNAKDELLGLMSLSSSATDQQDNIVLESNKSQEIDWSARRWTVFGED